ncbi:MAG TPA: SRPBCC family protein [Dehalococcoidia bacterium]|nr:SRPBCC family protein [Dehalococcoidia bacterium]
MPSVDKKIEVGVPLQTAYNQWTQFEEFPNFMEGVKEVRQIDDSRLFWAAEVGGERKEWFAHITRQVPDQVIAWESEGGTVNNGVVTFRPIAAGVTEVELRMEYEPEDMKEKAGDLLGVVSRRVEGDLERFKEFIESRGRETGAWRGEISGGSTETSGYSGPATP